MAIYHNWTSVSGDALNPTYAFDNSYGNTTTCATLSTTASRAERSHIYKCSQSLTGMSTVKVRLRWSYTVGVGAETIGAATLKYSWDGTTWYDLVSDWGDPGSLSAVSTEAVYSIGNFGTSTNLSNLQLKFGVMPGTTIIDERTLKKTYQASSISIYDIAVDAASGPVYTVNSISGPASIYAGLSGSFSTTVTNDATNNCTWSIVSGGGSLSGAVNDATSSRVTWTAPTVGGVTAVLRCRSNLDTSKYADITVSVPAVGISLTVGPSRMRAGKGGWYQVTVTGHSDTRAIWSVPAGTLDTSTANSVTWTVPTIPGKYVISGRHVTDTTKTFGYTVYVDWHYPSTFAFGSLHANVTTYSDFASKAYDQNESTSADLAWQWTDESALGWGYGYVDYYGFPSEPGLVSVDIQIKHSAGSGTCQLALSHDNGASWTSDASLVTASISDWHVFTLAPGVVFDLSAVRVRVLGEAGVERIDINETEVYGSGISIYEIVAVPRLRAYAACTSTANPGTTARPLYMPGQFKPLTGAHTAIGTTPVAIGSGVGALPYFLGGIAT